MDPNQFKNGQQYGFVSKLGTTKSMGLYHLLHIQLQLEDQVMLKINALHILANLEMLNRLQGNCMILHPNQDLVWIGYKHNRTMLKIATLTSRNQDVEAEPEHQRTLDSDTLST
jgi:hypothetical protein